LPALLVSLCEATSEKKPSQVLRHPPGQPLVAVQLPRGVAVQPAFTFLLAEALHFEDVYLQDKTSHIVRSFSSTDRV